MDKERREELREECGRVDMVRGDFARLTTKELRTLLDLANERDRYRELLEEAKPRLVMLYEHDGVRRLCKRIDAALEGKTND